MKETIQKAAKAACIFAETGAVYSMMVDIALRDPSERSTPTPTSEEIQAAYNQALESVYQAVKSLESVRDLVRELSDDSH